MVHAESSRRTNKSKRMANMELLRILSMGMVVMLHYLSKGKVLPALDGPMTANGYVAWILETFSIVAVNVYMLISGYFLVGSGFKCKRLVQLFCQVLFYSILIPLLLLATGILAPSQITIYKLLQYCLPAQMEHYWFVSAYVLMYLFSPILSTAVKNMKQRQHRAVLFLLLLILSVNKSVLPVRLEMDQLGYDAIWFLFVFLVASYIRLYGIGFFDKAAKGVIGYLGGCIGIFGIALLIRMLCLGTGLLGDFVGATYHYNHILNLFAAISLFYAFYHCKIPEGRIHTLIVTVAPYTFGVYLLHEQIEVRNLWPLWLGASIQGNPLFFVAKAILSVGIVFLLGIGVDAIRGWLFRLAGERLQGSRADKLLGHLDQMIAGREL